MRIAFLGTGLMGAGFVKRLIANGHAVNVWNRSGDKARALEAIGARPFAEAAVAVAGVERIQLSLSDDASVDAVLEPLAGLIPASTWIVDHTTTAANATGARAARWAARGRTYVHAPVFMGPGNAAEGTGIMLLAASKAQHEALLPHLKTMTGNVVYLGEAPERAAAFKLLGNLTILGFMGVLGDVARLAQAMGIPATDAYSLYQHFNPGATLPVRAARIAVGPYTPPMFETTMARKDVRLMLEEAERGGVDLLMAPALAAMFDAAIARGEGGWDCAAAARPPGPRQ
jgi:3-hydroxyisobutyrate dehydrogenase